MSRCVSKKNFAVHAAWIAKARAELPVVPDSLQLEAAWRVIATSMAHDKLDELGEYYLDELKSDDAAARAKALREMQDPVDLASYVSEQLEDGDERAIEEEMLLESVLAEFNEVVK